MAEQRGSGRVLASLTAGVVIGVVEIVLASSFAALIFGGALSANLADGVGLYLVGAALILGILAWTAGRRGVVGSVQDGPAVILAVVAASLAARVRGDPEQVFLTVVAMVVVASMLTGIVCLLLGAFHLGNVVRFVPYPVIGGFLAGTGWLLVKGGIGVASGVGPTVDTLRELLTWGSLARWLPALLFAVGLTIGVRLVRWPLLIPAALGIGVVAFAIGLLLTGSSVGEAEAGGWLLGPFPRTGLWQPWALRAITGADWGAVFHELAGIGTVVFVSVIATLLNASGIELMLRREFEPDTELRDAGVANLVAGAAGGIPGFHALSLTSLGERMDVPARVAGFVAAGVALATLVFGASLVALIPRMLLGGVILFLGLGFLIDWLFDARRTLPFGEWLIVVAIVATIIGWGLLPGVAVGLALAVVLFAVSYSRTDVVRMAVSGVDRRSNVDRPATEREALRTLGGGIYVISLQGFVFFGTAVTLLDRIRERAGSQETPLRFLVIDLRRVTGVDSSAVLAFSRSAELGRAQGFEVIVTGAEPSVRRQIELGAATGGGPAVRFEEDVDHGLERCEDLLLQGAGIAPASAAADGSTLGGLRDRLGPYLERLDVPAGAVVIRQGDRPDDVFLLESGRLRVEMAMHDGHRLRLRTMRPGVVVGEIALYTGAVRTADVVAEAPSTILRLSRTSLERMQRDDPALAADVHRWFAEVLADRLGETLRAVEALSE
jgi:SulP family sulfate permease